MATTTAAAITVPIVNKHVRPEITIHSGPVGPTLPSPAAA
jgi:hypothetical protein